MADDLVVKLVLNAAQFAAELDKEKAKLEELDAKRISDKNIRVNVDDAAARARLEQDTRPEEKVIRVRAEGGGGEGMGLGIASLLTGLPLLTPLLAAASAGAMGLASAFAAAGAGAAGLAAVAVPALGQVFEANKQIQKAQAAYANASTAKQRQAALQKEKDAWDELDAAQKQELRTLMEFQDFWQNFTKQFSQPVAQLWVNGIKMLETLLKDIQPVIFAAAAAFTQLESEASKALNSPFWKDFFGYLGGNARQMIVTFGEAIGNLIKGFAGLLMAFQPLSTDMATGLLHLTQRFAEWATHLQSDQGFQQFIQYVRQNGPLVVQLIGQLASILGKLLVAAAPLGHEMLQTALSLAQFLNHMLTVHPELGKLIVMLISGAGAFRLLHAGATPIISLFGSLARGVGGFSAAIRALMSGGLPGLVAHLRSVSPVIDGVAKVFGGLGRVIGPVVSGIGRGLTALGGVIRVFATGVVTALRAVAVAFMTNPITAIITLIVAAVAFGVYEIITHWTQVKKFLENTWNVIKTGASVAWNAIKSALSTAWNAIHSAAMSVFNAVKNGISSAWHAIQSVTSSVWNAIRGVIVGVWNGIRSVVSAGASTIRSTLSAAWNAIRSAVSTAWNAVVSTISGAVGRIWSTLSNLASQAFSWGRNLVNSLVGGITSMIGAVKNAVGGVAHAIASFLGFHSPTEAGPGKDADKWMPNLINMLAQGLYNGQGTIGKAASAAVDPISSSVQNAINRSQTQLNQYANATNAAMQRVAHAHTQAARAVAEAQLQHDRSMTAMVKSTISGLQTAQAIWNSYLKQVQSAQQTYQKNIQAVQEQLKKDEQKALEEYQNQVKQTTEQIAGFAGGLFGQVQHQEVRAQDLIANLQDQVSTLKQYNQDIKTLAARGVGDALLQQLEQLGPQAADQIHALSRMSDEQLRQYVSLWQQQMKQANDAAVTQLAPLKKQTEQTIQGLQQAAKQKMDQYYKDLQNSLRKISTNTAQELTKLAQNARAHGEKAVASMADAIKSKLPGLQSTAQQWGQNIVSSIAKGMQSATSLVNQAAKQVAQQIHNNLGFHSPTKEGPGSTADQWMPNLMNMLVDGIRRYTPIVRSALQQVIAPPEIRVNPQVGSMVRGTVALSAPGVGAVQPGVYNQNAPLFHIEQLVVRNDSDIQKIQQALYNANQRVLRAMGVRQV